MPGRPVGAAVLSLTGGLVVLLIGPIIWALGFCFACVEPRHAIPAAIEGFRIIAAGAGLYLDPTRHRVRGGAVVAFSIFSLWHSASSRFHLLWKVRREGVNDRVGTSRALDWLDGSRARPPTRGRLPC